MDGFSLRDLLIAAISSIVSVLGAFLLWIANLRKTRAEIERIEAEKHKLRAETEDLTTTRMFRELDRLAEINDDQFAVIEKQRNGIVDLRSRVQECAEREEEFVATEKALRLEIEKLRTPVLPMRFDIPINQILSEVAFPPDIPHPKTPDADAKDG